MAEYIEKWSVVNRLIDIENEIQQYKPFHGFEHAMYRKICEAEIAIGKTQPADVAPVRHGRWVSWEEADNFIPSPRRHECSVCYDEAQVLVNGFELLSAYCPNCGAKMDEVRE